MSLHQKTAFITGASRGIGKAIALRLAREGMQIVIAAKSVTENEKLGGTIYSAAAEVEASGGRALPVACDIRDESRIAAAVQQAVEKFGGIDIVINNASAISLTDTAQTTTSRFDLMHAINVRGSFLVVRHCLSYLKQSGHAHILTLSPPVDLSPRWLSPHLAYTLSKFNMSMMAMGWAAEFKSVPIASNSLWPRTTIDTAAVRNLLGGEALSARSRKPEIVADAAYQLLVQSPEACTGRCWIDEEVLREAGMTDFSGYAVDPDADLYPDLFL